MDPFKQVPEFRLKFPLEYKEQAEREGKTPEQCVEDDIRAYCITAGIKPERAKRFTKNLLSRHARMLRQYFA